MDVTQRGEWPGDGGLVMGFHGEEVRRAEKAFYEQLLLTIMRASATAVGVLVLHYQTLWIFAEISLWV